MPAQQISIFLENKAGRLSEVTRILSDAKVNIRALSLADTSDFGVLRLIVDNNVAAEKALKKGGFTVKNTPVVAALVNDRPGGLHGILDLLTKAGVNVEYMYAFVAQSGDNAVMIFRFDKIEDAERILSENNVEIIDGSRLYTM
jgi:hypothetical protein